MNMTAEVAYEDVAGQNLEGLEKDVEPVNVQLKKVKLVTR